MLYSGPSFGRCNWCGRTGSCAMRGPLGEWTTCEVILVPVWVSSLELVPSGPPALHILYVSFIGHTLETQTGEVLRSLLMSLVWATGSQLKSWRPRALHILYVLHLIQLNSTQMDQFVLSRFKVQKTHCFPLFSTVHYCCSSLLHLSKMHLYKHLYMHL